MKKLVIFGTGDIAQLANFYFETDSDYEVVAFTVDGEFANGDSFENKPLVHFENVESEYAPAEHDMFIALSYAEMNALRERKYNEAKSKGYALTSYVSSHCTYLSQFECGDNCFIFEDNTIQPFVKIGNNVVLWSGNHIGHHSEIKDHNFVSSHVVVSGHCVIEPNCFIGVNSTIAHQTTIAAKTLVGAGAVIAKNTEEGGVYVPARSTKLDRLSTDLKL